MGEMSKGTAVIVLNFNMPEITMDCINSLQKMDGEYDIFVLDNNSDKRKRDILIEDMKRRNAIIIEERDLNDFDFADGNNKHNVLIILEDNYGYAKGNNYGLRLAYRLGYQYSLLSNNDIQINDKKALVDLKKAMETDPKIAAIGPRITDGKSRDQGPFNKVGVFDLTIPRIFFPKGLQYGQMKKAEEKLFIKEVYRVAGAFILLKNTAIHLVDYFDEKTFLYYEESILSEKLINAGYKIGYYPGVAVVHKAGSTVSSQHTLRKSQHQLFISERYYFKKYRNMNHFMYRILLIGEFIWLNAWVPIIGIKRRLKRKSK